MIVEDNEPTAYLIQKAFEASGERVQWDLYFAGDGEEALDRLFRRGVHIERVLPDLVLLDWNLPKISGEEVLRKLKSHEQLQTLPVLIFSSSQKDHDVDLAYKARANGFIPKPSDLNGLFAVVENIEKFWCTRPASRGEMGGTSGITS